MIDFVVGQTLHDRAMSGFPVSIGTALALESLFTPLQTVYDPNRPIPTRVDVTQYSSCWINLTTLIRNLQGAVSKDVFTTAHPDKLAEVLFSEIEVIQGLFANEGRNLCRPEFYHSTYQALRRQHVPGFELRTPTTDLQKFYATKVDGVIRSMERATDTIHRFDDELKPTRREKALVITHQPYDLTGYTHFDKLDLLESHTGMLKPRTAWASKYAPMSGQSFAHLPFHRKLLMVFGDKPLIKPGPLPLRKQILDTSLSRHWTPLTTLDLMNLHLGLDVRDPYMIAVWKTL